jgi:uncharacterized membrane protein (Fun14 family)
VSFIGSLVGFGYGFLIGFIGGYAIAQIYNRIVDWKLRPP